MSVDFKIVLPSFIFISNNGVSPVTFSPEIALPNLHNKPPPIKLPITDKPAAAPPEPTASLNDCKKFVPPKWSTAIPTNDGNIPIDMILTTPKVERALPTLFCKLPTLLSSLNADCALCAMFKNEEKSFSHIIPSDTEPTAFLICCKSSGLALAKILSTN